MNTPKVKIGLALGGGGAKGLAHIGVLKALEENNISPLISIITGASMGSVMGGAYAMGMTVDELVEAYKHLKLGGLAKLRNWRLLGDSLIKDKKINGALQYLFGDATFEETKIPFYANAVDLESGERVILSTGKLWEATRASSAIPFIFTPVFLQDRYLVDGGLLDNVPVDIVREKQDVDILIGVELGGIASRQYISGMVWEKYYRKPKTFELYPSLYARLKMNTALMSHIMLRSLDILREVVEEEKYARAKPDFIIRPHVDSISVLDFKNFDLAYGKGIEATEKMIPALKKLIAEKEKEKAQQAIESTEGK